MFLGVFTYEEYMEKKIARKLTPIKAIRAKCLDCCCGSNDEVRLCPITDCPLHIYRMGTRDANVTLAKRAKKGWAS